MGFFLNKLGVRLADFPDDDTLPIAPLVDAAPVSKQPYLSSSGFELISDVDNTVFTDTKVPNFDPMSIDARTLVLNSFSGIALYVQDTQRAAGLILRINNDNNLVAIIPSINSMCSKLHVEDVSPIDNSDCNHETSRCDEAHYDDGSLLIDPSDYVACKKESAIFRIVNSILYMSVAEKWYTLNLKVNLPDNFYTLERNNFI